MAVSSSLESERRRAPLALLAPFLVYLVGVVLLGQWIIDDAGISFAYARNLARGYGFVAQPHAAPVEGVSDFLWVLLLVPTFSLRLFDPVITPKVLGALSVLGAFALIQRTLRGATSSIWPGTIAISLVALTPPIVIWTASGLENGLYLLLVAALLVLLVTRPRRWQVGAGLMAALLAMTRPDGLVFFVAGLIACLMEARANREDARKALLHVGQYVGTFVGLFGAFLGFRLAVFGLPWPHPYYAKREYLGVEDHLRFIAANPETLWAKVSGLGHAVAGNAGLLIVVMTAIGLAVLAMRRRIDVGLGAAAVMQACALVGLLWLEDDWMGEYRFATAAIALSLAVAILVSHRLFGSRRWALTAGWAAVAAIALVDSGPRFWRFASNPTTPFQDVVRETHRFNAYADTLGLRAASILTADVGGALMESRLRVFDLAGLCQPEVVRTLKLGTQVWNYHHPQFYDWVFQEARPTFVVTRQFWSNVTTLEQDPRFARDYLAIDAYEDAYVFRVFGRQVQSGEYVRRDAVADPKTIERLRALTALAEHEEPLIVRLADRFGLASPTRGASPSEVLQAARAARFYNHNPDRAANLFMRFLREQGENVSVLAELAEALDDGGRNLEGRSVWTRVRAAAGEGGDVALRDKAAARLALADKAVAESEQRQLMEGGLEALYETNRPSVAIGFFREVLKRNSSHYGATYQLAVALEKVGQAEETRTLWARVLEMAEGYRDAKTAAEAKARLDKLAKAESR